MPQRRSSFTAASRNYLLNVVRILWETISHQRGASCEFNSSISTQSVSNQNEAKRAECGAEIINLISLCGSLARLCARFVALIMPATSARWLNVEDWIRALMWWLWKKAPPAKRSGVADVERARAVVFIMRDNEIFRALIAYLEHHNRRRYARRWFLFVCVHFRQQKREIRGGCMQFSSVSFLHTVQIASRVDDQFNFVL